MNGPAVDVNGILERAGADPAAPEGSQAWALAQVQDVVDDLTADRDRLKARLASNKCGHGHVTIPLALWDCPQCHEATRQGLARAVQDKQELEAALRAILFQVVQGAGPGARCLHCAGTSGAGTCRIAA